MLKFWKNRWIYETIIRYLLSLSMLPYGLSKIFRIQFIVLPFYTWSESLKDISGPTLAWAFLGYSSWFTVLLGVLEVIPSILLLFRRTKLLGAILLFPILVNILLINFALDLWLNTKIISATLTLLNFALLLFHYQLLEGLFKRILNHVSIIDKKIKLEVLVNIILLGMVTSLSINELKSYTDQRNFLTGDWYNKRPVYWVVKATPGRYNDLIVSDFRYYFQPFKVAYVMAPGKKEPVFKNYQLDEQNHILSLYNSSNPSSSLTGIYTIIDNNTVEWDIGEENKLLLIRHTLD